MRNVPATKAKAHFAQLLSIVEHGESIAITRHGKPIAHLVPAAAQDRDSRRAAVERFLAERSTWKRAGMSIEEILAARNDGQRY